MKDQFILSPPNQYHPANYKAIMVEDWFYCLTWVPIRDANTPEMVEIIKEEMQKFITFRLKTQPIRKFTYLEVPVEIRFNGYRKKFFWVTGESPDRFIGACEYFTTPTEAEDDIRKELDRIQRGKRL